MKKLFMSLVVLLSGIMAAIADPQISFESIVHDFGTFPEESGRVSTEFVFTNTGDADLVLQKVRASCGCTTPDWTKAPVKPGEKGSIKVTYNASGRPGSFNKTITVSSNAGEKRLSIKGEVIPKAQKIEDKYQHQFGDLRLRQKNVYFNTVFFPNSKTAKIEAINNGQSEIKIGVENVTDFIKVVAPQTLKPGEKAMIEFTLVSDGSDYWGSFKKFVNLVVNGKVYSDNPISVYGNIAEDFGKMTEEQKANAPVMAVANSVSLGDIKKGSTKTYEFKVQNNGKSPLILRSVTIDATNSQITFPSKAIKPGKQGAIRVKVNSGNMKSGKYTQRITIISNDPQKSSFIVNLNGVVVE